MSVVSIINTGDAVHMFTDGGLFADDGSVSAILSKAYALPHLSAVFSSRGTQYLACRLMLAASHSFSSFEGLVEGITGLLFAQYQKHADVVAGREFELWFCGYSSERERFESYVVSSHGLSESRHGVDAVPWTLAPLDDRTIVPRDGRFESRLAAFSTNTPEELGVAIAECQRQLRGTSSRGVEITGLAGFIQMSTVARDGISTKVLKRFPDEIGKPVIPSPENFL